MNFWKVVSNHILQSSFKIKIKLISIHYPKITEIDSIYSI